MSQDAIGEVAPVVDQDAVSERVEEIVKSRAVIEQTKGMLMAVYRISEDSAFNLLLWQSQETNVKLRALSAQIIGDFRTMDSETTETFTARQ